MTRRAVISVFTPFDLEVKTRDFPCLVSLQFLLREGVLHSVCHMRSQSALLVMPYDLFLLTMLHEAMSVRLGLVWALITTSAGSLHFYEDEEQLVDAARARAGPPPRRCPP